MRGDGQNQLQIAAPLPLREIYRIISLSAKPISLDSPFKEASVKKHNTVVLITVFYDAEHCFKARFFYYIFYI
jgi:hypothetical protein